MEENLSVFADVARCGLVTCGLENDVSVGGGGESGEVTDDEGEGGSICGDNLPTPLQQKIAEGKERERESQ